MKLVITGGHHTTAFAVVDELKKQIGDLDILWLGHKYSMWGDKAESLEYLSVQKRGMKFLDLKTGKFHRTFHPFKLLRIPFGFIQAFYYLLRFKPELIFSFGGYLAVPVVISGWCLGMPSVTHEQTTTVGLANKVISKFVKKIFISWPQSKMYFPRSKVIVSGNPLRKKIFIRSIQICEKFKEELDKSKKTIYITGGKQGAHIINEAIKPNLSDFLNNFNLIHQCGRSTLYGDYEVLRHVKDDLPERLKKRYILKDYIADEEIGSVFAICDLVVTRAGANIVYELAALGKVAIFIPIPWLPYDEQTKNAQVLVGAGSAELLTQEDLNAEKLLGKINKVFADYERYKEAAEIAKGLVRLDAAEKIISELEELFPKDPGS